MYEEIRANTRFALDYLVYILVVGTWVYYLAFHLPGNKPKPKPKPDNTAPPSLQPWEPYTLFYGTLVMKGHTIVDPEAFLLWYGGIDKWILFVDAKGCIWKQVDRLPVEFLSEVTELKLTMEKEVQPSQHDLSQIAQLLPKCSQLHTLILHGFDMLAVNIPFSQLPNLTQLQIEAAVHTHTFPMGTSPLETSLALGNHLKHIMLDPTCDPLSILSGRIQTAMAQKVDFGIPLRRVTFNIDKTVNVNQLTPFTETLSVTTCQLGPLADLSHLFAHPLPRLRQFTLTISALHGGATNDLHLVDWTQLGIQLGLCPQLKRLGLFGVFSATDFQRLVEQVCRIPNGGIETLWLSNHRWSLNREFMDFSLITGLTDLNLRLCHLSNQMWAVAPLIGSCRNLLHLGLTTNFFSPADFKALRPQLMHLTRLQSLDLSQSMLANGLPYLPDVLASLPHLEKLVFSQNELPLADLEPSLACAVNLTHLNLERCWLDATAFARLLPTLEGLTHLQTLDLSNNNLCDDGMIRLANSMACWPHLTRLSAGSVGMTDQGFSVLVPNCSQLCKITLDDSFDESSCDVLVKHFPKWPRMSALLIRSWMCSTEALQEALMASTVLVETYLWDPTLEHTLKRNVIRASTLQSLCEEHSR